MLKQGRLTPLLLYSLCLLILLLPDSWQQMLRYENTAIGNGEVWRLFSAHLVHLGWPHLLLNLLAFWLILELFFLANRRLTLRLLLLALGTSLGLLLFSPHVGWYVGFSGVLHGLLALALLDRVLISPQSSVIMLALLAGKLLWEQLQGPLPGSVSLTQGSVIVDAHLYGAIAGAVVWGLERSALPFRNEDPG